MRHARKAAMLVIALSLAMVSLATASMAPIAQPIDSPGGTPAPTAGSASQSGGEAAGGTGASAGTQTGTGGSSSSAPSTKGTGGSEYGVKPRKTLSTPRKPSGKKAPRKPVRVVHRKPAKPKTKAKPKSTGPKTSTPKPAAPAPATPPSTPAGVPTPVQLASAGAVFPVAGPHSFGDAANRFGAGRAGYEHQGQDVLASEGLSVVAPLAGTIITTGFQAGGAGWYIAEHTGYGVDFFYAHCQAGSLAVSAAGQTVSAGQVLCKVGQTGDATGPHLHFEVWIGGWRASGGKPIDPLPYLQAWDHD